MTGLVHGASLVIGLRVVPTAGRLIVSFVSGLTSYDAVSPGSAIFALTTVALLAGYLPASPAAAVDPVVAIGSE